MKPFALFLLLGLCAHVTAETTNTPPAEPVYEGKPVTYWVARFAMENVHLSDVQIAPKAIRTIGITGAPWIIRYGASGYPKEGKFDQPRTQFAVQGAFRFFSNSDKSKVDEMISGWLQDANPQVRANAIALLRIPVQKDHLALVRRLRNDPDQRVQQAIRFMGGDWGPNWRDETDDILDEINRKAETVKRTEVGASVPVR